MFELLGYVFLAISAVRLLWSLGATMLRSAWTDPIEWTLSKGIESWRSHLASKVSELPKHRSSVVIALCFMIIGLVAGNPLAGFGASALSWTVSTRYKRLHARFRKLRPLAQD